MALEHELDSAIALAVRRSSSQSALGRSIKRKNGRPVGQSTVREWLKSGVVPPEYVLQIEAVTLVSRHELRPDIYPLSEDAAPYASDGPLFENPE